MKYADGGELDWTFLAQNRREYIGVSRAAAGQRFQEDPNAPKGLLQFTFKGDRSQLDAADRSIAPYRFAIKAWRRQEISEEREEAVPGGNLKKSSGGQGGK
ncbi:MULTISPECIES: hypothetical protein [unclassified Paenibacillus]|uniref:hypothetical protein n=1 Tax=unclassified Paenibacillus TaxID=185978 RepID=UPI0006D07C02|nr:MULTISPECIES: hypothetical protein [unclassified Paenibacillus]